MHILERKMPKYNTCCFVYGCFSTSSQNRNLGFHKFPHGGERKFLRTTKYGIKQVVNRRQLWMEALNIGKGASYTVDEIRVCSLHFAKSDFYQPDGSGLWFLKKTALPRRNLPTRWSSPLTTRFSIRSLNRLKYRGYFTIHNPDGRKLTVRRRFLGSNYNKQITNTSSYQKTVWIARKPPIVENIIETDKPIKTEKDNESSSDWQGAGIINAHSLADKTEFNDDHKETLHSEERNNISTTFAKDSENDGYADDEVTCTGSVVDDGQLAPDTTWSSSEVIIKEELISDSEDEFALDGKLKNNKDANHKISENEELYSKEAELLDQQNEEIEIKEEEKEPEEEEEEEEIISEMEEENYDEEKYDTLVEGINCKVCGEENCQGHPGSRPKENFFVCLVCSEIFTSKKQLGLHSKIHDLASTEEILMAEQKAKDLTCLICGRILSTRATLREHIMIHTGEKPYKCLLCGKSFRHKANLVVHVNAHTVVNTFNCPECSETFSKRIDLEKHIRGHLYSEYVCTICNSKFKSQRTLYNHSILHTKKGEVRKKKSGGKPKGGKLHICKVCGKILSTSATLREHMLIHSGEKPHVCLLCGKTVRHKANFVVHVQSHSRGQSFECNICEDAFLKKSELRHHKQLMHSQIKVYSCPICGISCKSLAKFNEHAETHSVEEVDRVTEQEENYDYEVLQPHLLEAFLTES